MLGFQIGYFSLIGKGDCCGDLMGMIDTQIKNAEWQS
jgi:hypothetical protein